MLPSDRQKVKKRIIVGLACFAAIFLLGGAYLIGQIERATSTLDNLIKLHQVEILREQLLLSVKRTQLDFAYREGVFGRELDSVIDNVVVMTGRAKRCLECHHSRETAKFITDLGDNIGLYQDALSRVLTTRGRTERLKAEEDEAIKLGQGLVDQLDDIVVITKEKLERRTRTSLRAIRNTKLLLFALICAGPVLSMGLAIIFLKGITGPVNVLLQATRKIKGGDLTFRVQGLKDEFGEVAESFNEMAASLEEQMENLQRTEQLRVVGEMAAGFIHEIKNPLAGIKATMQVLLQEGAYSDDDRIILSEVEKEAMRIESLVKSLLDFAKPPKPQLIETDINLVLESTLAFAMPYTSLANGNHSVQIVKELDGHMPFVLADPTQMRQVFLNLIMNGAEAMPHGGTLTLRTRGAADERHIEIEIGDTGKGIGERAKEHLFRPFFTTRRKGTGLGLAITRRLVEMHEGAISVESVVDKGTVFTITLPLAARETVYKSDRETVGL
jgi:signal transduction histidine kinase